MEKPLDVPLLLKTIAELVAEEPETHLKRLVGMRRDLRYARRTYHSELAKEERTNQIS